MSACLFILVYTCIRDFRVNRIVKFGVSTQFCENSHNLSIIVNKGINMVWVINWPDVCYYPQCTLIILLNRGLYNQKILNQISGLHACFWMWNWILSCQNLSYMLYSMFPIKRTVFLCTVTLLKNTVHLIGDIEYMGVNWQFRKVCFMPKWKLCI